MVPLLAWSALGLLLAAAPAQAEENVPLRFSAVVHSARVQDLGDGVYEVRTTGEDPYVVLERVERPFDHARLFVLAFDYLCPEGLDFFEVYFGSPFHGGARFASAKVPPAPDWRPFAANLRSVRSAWNDQVRDFRLDLGSGGDHVVRIRNLRLRAMTPGETQAEEEARAAERRRLAEMQQRVERTLIAPAKIADRGDVMAAAHTFTDGRNVTRVAVVGRELDLATQLREYAGAVRTPVPLPPPMVAGEGRSPRNHTLVRVLNRHGICEVQFLAYPPAVRGGVQVAVGRVLGGKACIVTAPLADATVRELRVFSGDGNWLATLPVPASLQPPFAVAVGSFAGDGQQIAVASARASGGDVPILLLDGAGKPLKTLRVPLAGAGTLSLAARAVGPAKDEILAYVAGQPDFWRVDPVRGASTRQSAGLPRECTGVYASSFAERPFAAAEDAPLFSYLHRMPANGPAERQNVGERENLFWFTADGRFREVPEGRYTRRSRFAHIRTDFGSPRASDPDFARADADFWAGPEYVRGVEERLKSYDTDPPVCWEPCFTHRWFYARAQKWGAARDVETGLPEYTLVTRENDAATYGEFGETRSFLSGSYAPGLQAVERFYTYPQRAFLQALVRRFRGNPEHFIAVEPNHEMEINAESESSHGDYNPTMIRAFYRYLVSLYGDLEGINRVFGTPFTPQRFDAPRDLQRGAWDAYSTENPYYLAWMRFMNYAIYRVVAGTYREALLAGFPPEAIKCHQIPDHYAIASLTAFSKPARRVTPIDWNLNAGVGFGFTKYGVWYNQEHNCVQGPHSSGFDAMVVGEYQSLTPDANQAYNQLAYLRDHGVQFIHCMNWPQSHDRGYNDSLAAALERLAKEDQPRPGLAGGTGQVRPARVGGKACDIVSLGTGSAHTGLLKSVGSDGRWNGAVYVVPFHAHVDVQPLMERPAAELAAAPLSFGPFPGINAGSVLDFAFLARSESRASVSFRLYHHGVELPALRVVIPVAGEWRHYRCQVRVQVDTDDLRVEVGAGDAGTSWLKGRVLLRDLVVTRQTEKSTKLKQGILAGERHEGGVTFDVLPAEE